MAVFDQSRDDRAAEHERCRRRRDQSIVVLTAEARRGCAQRLGGGVNQNLARRTGNRR